MTALTSFITAARTIRERLPFGAAIHKTLREPYYRLMEATHPRGVIVRLSDGHTARLHPRMMGIRPEDYEAGLVAKIREIVPAGGRVLDIGAHVGLQALIFAHATGPKGQVICVEPSPANAELLRHHLAWNNLAQVSVVEAAVSDAVGTAAFSFFASATDWGGFSNSLAYNAGGEITEVSVITIDTLCRDFAPDLIKIDVEGAELHALRGGATTLSRVKPTLIVAIHPEAMGAMQTTPKQLIAFMEVHGYAGHTLSGERARDPGFEEVIFTPVKRQGQDD